MAAIFLASVPAILGCSQEGKTVQTQLPVQGVAYSPIAVFDTTVEDTIRTVTMNVRFKVQTRYLNGCEARGGIEIHSETNPSLLVMTPLARYTVDEACNVGISGDTVQTLTVNAIIFRADSGAVIQPSIPLNFEVRGANAPPIEIQLDMDNGETLDSTRWEVRVEDAATAAPLAGAIVRIEDASGPEVYGEGPADANGLYVLERGCTGVVGDEDIHYVVKVSYSGRTAVLRMGSQPARCRRLESVIVRVE
jgi:hypothetical protein